MVEYCYVFLHEWRVFGINSVLKLQNPEELNSLKAQGFSDQFSYCDSALFILPKIYQFQ